MPTFQLSNTVPSEKPTSVVFEEYLKSSDAVKKNNGTLLKWTTPVNAVKSTFGHGFVGACFEAYSHHHHLVMRPDDVWLAIMIAFAKYVEGHAEEMRSLFVSHDGQKPLEVVGDGTLYTTDWNHLIAQMSTLIHQQTKGEVRAWMEPNFSTTTPKDRLIGTALLMGAMKKYFSYKFSLRCGLPAVTLEGTLEDWKELRHRADQLLTFNHPELQKWHSMLTPVLDEFLNTYQGHVNANFWNTICHHITGHSGPSYLTGWLNVFIPFVDGKYALDKKNAYGETYPYGVIDTKDVPSGMVEVPVTIDDNGTIYKTLFYAGTLVPTYDPISNQIRASYDWVIVDVTASKYSEFDADVKKLEALNNARTNCSSANDRLRLMDEYYKLQDEFNRKWQDLLH